MKNNIHLQLKLPVMGKLSPTCMKIEQLCGFIRNEQFMTLMRGGGGPTPHNKLRTRDRLMTL